MAAKEQYLVALTRLQANPDFMIVLEQMQEDLRMADKANRRLSGEGLYRSQGTAVYLDEFLDRVTNARANVEKMRANRTPNK